MANPFDNLSNEELIGLLGGDRLTFDQQMKIAMAPRSSSSSSSSVSSQDPAQFAENMKLLRDQLRESSLGREQKTAIDKYLAQLQERNQRFVELKSAQDNLIKVAEQRENARQGDNNRRESARQANLKAAVDQYQTALSLIPQMGQLAIEESKRVQSILQDGGDFLARAFESRGGKSPLATVSQADQINSVIATMSTLRKQIDDALAGGPPDPNMGAFDGGQYQPPALAGGFGAQLGEMPTLSIPEAAPQPVSEAAAVSSGGGGFSGGGQQAAAQAPQGFSQYLTPNYVYYGDPAVEGYPSTVGAYDSIGPVTGSPQPGGAPVLQEDGSRVQSVGGGFARFLPNGEIVQPNGQTINERMNTTLPGYKIPGGNAVDRYQNATDALGRTVIDQVMWGPKKIGGFLGSLYDMTPAGKRASGKTLSGYADGGMTREGAFIVGDHPSGMPMGTEEMVVNPTNAPIKVIPNPKTQQMMGGFSRYAGGTDDEMGSFGPMGPVGVDGRAPQPPKARWGGAVGDWVVQNWPTDWQSAPTVDDAAGIAMGSVGGTPQHKFGYHPDAPRPLTKNDLQAARDWLKELEFGDITPAEIDRLNPDVVWNAINRNWDGGIDDFIRTGMGWVGTETGKFVNGMIGRRSWPKYALGTGGFSRYATGTGNTDWVYGNTAFTGMNPQQAADYAQATPGLSPMLGQGGSYMPTPEARGGFLAQAGAWLARPTSRMTYQGQQLDKNFAGFNSQGTYYSQGGKAVYEKDLDSNTGWQQRPNFTSQKELVEMARRTSPPALQALFNNTAVPAATALKSTVPGEEVYMKTPTARQWMSLTPEEQKAAMARYNVEFNAGAGYVPNRIAAQYGSTGSRQRGFVGAAGL